MLALLFWRAIGLAQYSAGFTHQISRLIKYVSLLSVYPLFNCRSEWCMGVQVDPEIQSSPENEILPGLRFSDYSHK